MPLKTPLLLSLLASAALVAAPTISVAQPAEQAQTEEAQKGYDIAARSDRSDTGFGSSEASAVMVLRNAAGQESPARKLRFLTLERENEDVGDKSLVIFESPRDVEGTALLSHAKILDADDQWLYLPALKRVKR
ncbi:MAG: outer membrane lipoprotein-sorting protein, partial [Pseudomonadota bacterium]